MTDPQRLVDALTAGGWSRLNGDDSCVRLLWPGHLDGVIDRPALYVPLDQTDPDFGVQWDAAFAELGNAVNVGVKAAYALAGQHAMPGT